MKEMDNIVAKFLEFATFDNDYELNGIREDAPEYAKTAYKQFLKLTGRKDRKGKQ